jgi:hypothetical protein
MNSIVSLFSFCVLLHLNCSNAASLNYDKLKAKLGNRIYHHDVKIDDQKLMLLISFDGFRWDYLEIILCQIFKSIS